MKKIVLSLLALAILALSGLASPAVQAANDDAYIVVYKDGIADDGDARTTRHEREQGFAAEHRYGSVLKGFAAHLNARQLETLRGDPDVAFISRDGVVRAIGMVPVAAGDSVPTGVRRIGAGTTTTVHQASNANVAVIDTGVDLTHPDLNAVSGKNCVRTNRNANDDNGHGSHVAGTIAAKNNGSGVVGVAPGTKIYAVKVLNAQGSGTWSQVICGIDWVAANAATLNIKVANMSLGGGGSNDNNCGNSNNDAMHKAICNATAKGVTFVVAAGNSATNLSTSVPAAYSEALTVSAVSDSDGQAGGVGGAPTCRTGELDDKYATFSNYAVAGADQNHVVAAPGVCIRSTWKSGGYNTISGTSMATPHVTGVVALCIGNGGTAGACNGKTPAQIIQQIRADAQASASVTNGFNGDPLHPVAGKYFGYMVYAGGY
ncbi:MAG: S8 family serine peptidase [Chloroflexi bacterium]|nr:S8 family serine peptidase [Chloroflexota bacterium]